MTTIREIRENGLQELKGYDELADGAKFIYSVLSLELFAIKLNSDYSVLLNGDNCFIVARHHKNCLSIGSRPSPTFDTFEEAKAYASTKPELK